MGWKSSYLLKFDTLYCCVMVSMCSGGGQAQPSYQCSSFFQSEVCCFFMSQCKVDHCTSSTLEVPRLQYRAFLGKEFRECSHLLNGEIDNVEEISTYA